MRIDRKRRTYCVFCLFFICVILLTGCSRAGSPPSLSRMREQAFVAEARGTMNGQQLLVRLCVSGRADTPRAIRAEYLSPSPLNGVTVTATVPPDTADRVSEGGTAPTLSSVQISYLGHTLDLSPTAADGLLSPLTVLFSLDTPLSIQKGHLSHTLAFEPNVTLVLAPDGTPLSLSTPYLSLEFTSWEWILN